MLLLARWAFDLDTAAVPLIADEFAFGLGELEFCLAFPAVHNGLRIRQLALR